MDTYREELSRIKDVLKKNPKGMNVIEIARSIGMHRQSVTKYLEMLMVSGHVEVKAFGPSKVYYLSQRLPVSAMLSLSSDLILLLDRDLKIINVNDAFLTFVNTAREDILNKEMSLVSLPLEFNPPIQPYISDALDGNESRIEALFKNKNKELYFNIKFIPVVFDDGQPGATVLFEDVTDQKKAAQANERLFLRLKESEQRFRTLIQNLKSGVMLVEGNGRFSIYNPSFQRMFGFTDEEMEKLNITSKEWNDIEMFDGDGNPMPREERPSIKTFTTGQPVRDMLVGLRRPGGGIIWALTNVALLKSPEGRVDKLICTYYDITERKLHEERIARLTRLYATLSRVNEAIINIHEEETLYAQVCQIVMEEGGFPLVWVGLIRGQQVVPVARSGRASGYLDEITVEVNGELGMGPTGTCIREGRAVINDDFAINPSTLPWQRPAMSYGFRASAAFPIYCDGKVIGAFTLYASEPNVFDAEQVRLLQSLSSDISKALDAIDNERYNAIAERALRENEEKLSSLFQMLPIGVSVLDKNNNIIVSNPALDKILGITAKEYAGKAYDMCQYVRSNGSYFTAGELPMAIASNEKCSVSDIEVGVVAKDSSLIWTNMNAVPLPFADWSAVVTMADITRHKQAEKELADAKAQVELYLDLLNHDISNMHQVVLSQLELAREIIAEKGRLESEDLELINMPIEAIMRSDKLISNVRDLQKLSEGAYDTGIVDIGEMLAEVVREHMAGPGRRLNINYVPADGCLVNANSLLKDVFSSLMSPGVRQSNGATTINITVDRADGNGFPCYRVTIEDDGPGIPDDKKEQVLHHFKRGHAGAARGSVLSQHIAKSLMESFHGHLKVEDRVQGDYTKGSKFVVELPVAEAKNGQ